MRSAAPRWIDLQDWAHVLLFALLLAAVWPQLARAGKDEDGARLADAEAAIQQGRARGIDYLQTKDKKARSEAREALDRAERLMKKAVADDKNCERCAELLAGSYFYQGYFGFEGDYDRCIDVVEKSLERFPANAKLAFYRGYANYNRKKYDLASRDLKRYLLGTSGDPQTEAQVREILKDSQGRFLQSWNRHTNFYNSSEARIVTYNAQAQQNQVIFQATPELEMQLGNQAYEGIAGTARQIQDPELNAYLGDMVQRLVGHSPGSPFQYRVTVIDDPNVNAVTPPGHIIVFSGLLGFVETEAELAGVLAHELAHNYAHHVARRVHKAYTTQMVASALTAAINPQSQLAQLATVFGANIGMGLVMNAFSRSDEKEADLYGSHILFNAGWDPTAMSSFFLKMYKHNPKQPPKFLSTHPPVPDRADYVMDYLEGFPLEKELKSDSEAFQKIRQKFARVASGPWTGSGPGQGALPPVP